MSPIPFVSGGRPARRSFVASAGAAVAALVLAPALGAAVIDFSDLTLAASSYYDGGPLTNSAGWTSGGASFNNSVTNWGGSFYSWAGFAYSNQTDTTTPGYVNQYSAYNLGASTGTYAVGYYSTFDGYAPTISFGGAVAPQSIWLANTTWAALAMRDGNGASRKFAAGDYFNVVITGLDQSGVATGAAITHALADFRAGGSYIADDWTEVDLGALGANVWSIKFSFESTDIGDWGINTPAYVAIDNLNFVAVPEPSAAAALAGLGALGLASLRRRRGAVAA